MLMAFRSKSGTEIPQTVVYQDNCLCKGMRIHFLEIMVALQGGDLLLRNIKLNVVLYRYMFE